MNLTVTKTVEIGLHHIQRGTMCEPRCEAFVAHGDRVPLSYHPGWLTILREGLGQEAYLLEAVQGGATIGLLPLALLRSRLFGRFLVGLPYLNYGGVLCSDDEVTSRLIGRAVELADQLGVRHLELRHRRAVEHARLTTYGGQKVHMIRELPATPGQLWDELAPKVRNQVRKGQKSGLAVVWGRDDLVEEFYDVFSRNMRDLGTPVYSRRLFQAVLRQFPTRAEICVVRLETRPIAAGLLIHGWKTTEIPSASSLRAYNHTCANMLMYWHMLERTIQLGQETFDFGRSTPGGPVFKFKEQWGAKPEPAEWQYYVRTGSAGEMRPDNPRYQRLIRVWKRLPVWVTRFVGPAIVRGIP
jgi:FemAB-related protein (PEP-CTERM system-associated)